MMKSIYAVLFICLLACSPYKKVTLTATERLTKTWQGATEQTVSKTYGYYKEKNTLTDGYLMRFDYSYLLPVTLKKSSDFQIKASNQRTSPMLPQSNNSYGNGRSSDDSVIKRIDLYFDKSQHVQSVIATGFPDTVYYVKRK